MVGGGGGGGGGLIFETNCIFEYKPPPHFRLDVVYKMGGRINGILRYFLHWGECVIHFVALLRESMLRSIALLQGI